MPADEQVKGKSAYGFRRFGCVFHQLFWCGLGLTPPNLFHLSGHGFECSAPRYCTAWPINSNSRSLPRFLQSRKHVSCEACIDSSLLWSRYSMLPKSVVGNNSSEDMINIYFASVAAVLSCRNADDSKTVRAERRTVDRWIRTIGANRHVACLLTGACQKRDHGWSPAHLGSHFSDTLFLYTVLSQVGRQPSKRAGVSCKR